MRTILFLLVAGLALGAVAVVSATAAQAAGPTPPYHVFSMSGSGTDPVFGADYVFDQATGDLDATVQTPSDDIQFRATTPGVDENSHGLTVDVFAADGTALAAKSYTLVDAFSSNVTGNARMSFYGDNGDYCDATAGTLDISQLDLDGSNNIVAFSADYSGITCSAVSTAQGPVTLSGTARWGTDHAYSAVAVGPRSWNWGDQLYKVDAQLRTFTFTNDSSAAVTPGTPSITGATGVFTIKSNTCTAALAPGATCTVTVNAHALHAATPDVGALHVPMSGMADRLVNLIVIGDNFASEYALAGPQRVRVHWRQLPAPIGATVDHYRLLRGSGPHTLGLLRNVANACCPVDSTDGSVTAGTVYYYAVQPVFTGGVVGVTTPVVAAKPWPKYSSGMYHRIAPSRMLSNHAVQAGHPYSLKLLGQHHVPSTGVSAVVLTVTAGKPSRDTSVTVYPRGSAQPAVADVAVPSGATRSNLVIAKVGKLGSVLIGNAHGTAAVTVDVSGYFSAPGLATTNGMGAGLHEYTKGGTILDTKGWGWGPLPSGYYADAPVNFDALDTPHVTSLLVQVTAFGSTAGGIITGYATNGHVPGTSVLSYAANTTSTTTAIISAGKWTDSSTFQQYPSVSFLNRGAKPVQLKVSILGFFDDNTFLFGQRYHPTAPKRLLDTTLYSGGMRMVSPGSYGHTTTTALDLKVRASAPTLTTALSMWPRCCSVTNAAQPQLRALRGKTTVDSTLEATGTSNRFEVRNAAGRTGVQVWAFGTFDFWPVPAWQWFVGEYADETAVTAAAASVVENRFDDAARATGGAPVIVDHLSGVSPGRVTEHARYRNEFRTLGR